MPEASASSLAQIRVLDGWRAVSIMLVLFAHWVPAPRAWQVNAAAGASGMALFFSLSGFLITQSLFRDDRVGAFLVRRLTRIIPLAWSAIAIMVIVSGAGIKVALFNLLFVANLPPAHLMSGGEHLWSLCVEVQFYGLVALLIAAGGQRWLYILPVACVMITILRVLAHQPISIITWHRVDEILAGATVALISRDIAKLKYLPKVTQSQLVILSLGLFLCSHPESGPLQYLRPYLAAAIIFSSLYLTPGVLMAVLASRFARYVARVSFAVYVIHGMLTATWLGGNEGPKLRQYTLRPVLAAVTFILAHCSTFFFEKFWTDWGKRWVRRWPSRTA